MNFFSEHKIKWKVFILPHNTLRSACSSFLLAIILIGNLVPFACAMEPEDDKKYIPTNTQKVRPPLTKERIEKLMEERRQEKIYYQEVEEALLGEFKKSFAQTSNERLATFTNLKETLEENFATHTADIEFVRHQAAAQQTALQGDVQNLTAQVNHLIVQEININGAIDNLYAEANNIGASINNIENITTKILELKGNKEEKANSSAK